MKQKPLEDITVKEVMSLADVNRATFYAHFSNIADLVNAIEEDVAAAVVQTAERLIGQSHNPADVADAIFTAIVRDTQIYDWLVSPNSTGRAKRLICEYARKHCLEGGPARRGSTPPRQTACSTFVRGLLRHPGPLVGRARPGGQGQGHQHTAPPDRRHPHGPRLAVSRAGPPRKAVPQV